jgi:hypothetical protein
MRTDDKWMEMFRAVTDLANEKCVDVYSYVMSDRRKYPGDWMMQLIHKALYSVILIRKLY